MSNRTSRFRLDQWNHNASVFQSASFASTVSSRFSMEPDLYCYTLPMMPCSDPIPNHSLPMLSWMRSPRSILCLNRQTSRFETRNPRHLTPFRAIRYLFPPRSPHCCHNDSPKSKNASELSTSQCLTASFNTTLNYKRPSKPPLSCPVP